MVLVLGEESDGLSDAVWEGGDMRLSVGGTGNVESLNVSVATGIIPHAGGSRIKSADTG